MLSFLYVYSDHSILECYNLFSGVELSMRSFFVISYHSHFHNVRCLLISYLIGIALCVLFLSDWPAMWCSLVIWEIKPELEGV